MNGIQPTNALSANVLLESTGPSSFLPLFLAIVSEKFAQPKKESTLPQGFEKSSLAGISSSDIEKYHQVFAKSFEQSRDTHPICESETEFAFEGKRLDESLQRGSLGVIEEFSRVNSFYETGGSEEILPVTSSFHTLLSTSKGQTEALGDHLSALISLAANTQSEDVRDLLAMKFFSLCDELPLLSTFINSISGDIKQREDTLITLIAHHPFLYKLPPEFKKVFADDYFNLGYQGALIQKRELFAQAVNDTLPALFPTSDPYIGNAITSGVQDYGSVALLTSNAFLTVYASPGSSSNTELRASHWFINGSYVDDFTIDTHSSLKKNTVVLTLSDGNVLIAWDRRSDGSASISSRGAIYNVESDRVGNSFSLLTASSGSFVSLAAKPSGYTVAFTTLLGGDSVGQYQEFTGSNIPVGNRVNIGFTTAVRDIPPQIFPFNNDDHRIALWTDERDDVQEIRGQVVRRSDSSFLGDTFYINPELVGNQTLLGMQPLLTGNGAVLVESDGEIFLTIIAPPPSPNIDPAVTVVNGPVSVFEAGEEYQNGQIAVSSQGIGVIAQCDRGVCVRLMKLSGVPMGASSVVIPDIDAKNPRITFKEKELVASWEIADSEGDVFVRSLRVNTSPVPTEPIPPAVVSEGEIAVIPVPAEQHFFDADGHKMTLSAYGGGQTELPSFVEFNSDTEEFLIQPGFGTDGNYTLCVAARDGFYYEDLAQQEFLLRVIKVTTSTTTLPTSTEEPDPTTQTPAPTTQDPSTTVPPGSGLGTAGIVSIVSAGVLLVSGALFLSLGGFRWMKRKMLDYEEIPYGKVDSKYQ